MKEVLDTLIEYRLQQAAESIRDARILVKAGGSFRSIINRSYYAMFYSLLALLAKKSIGTSKHSGIIAIFDREYVKENIFPKDMSRVLHKAFYLRQEGDYKEFNLLSKDDTLEILNGAEKFLIAIVKNLKQD
jgi:uncharacterized protein (UPF0332 family)